jgi:uncharacterized protein (TIGR02246 family)
VEPAVDPARQAADIQAIKANEEQKWPAAVNAGDFAAAADVFTEDGIWLAPGVPADFGREAIAARLQSLHAVAKAEDLTQKVEEVEVAGDWAWVRATYSLRLVPAAGGEPWTETGKYLLISKRQPDGSWKSHRSCFNTDHPVPSPKP